MKLSSFKVDGHNLDNKILKNIKTHWISMFSSEKEYLPNTCVFLQKWKYMCLKIFKLKLILTCNVM